MVLEAKKIGMLVGPGYEDLEFWVVYMRMVEEGAEVLRIGLEAGERYSSKHGCLTAACDRAAADVSADDIDALLIPGGWAPDRLRRSQAVTGLVHDVYVQGKVVGLICHAGLVGISAGIVRGKRATGSLGIKDDLLNAGAQWVDVPALTDGNLVWGRVVEDIPAYCRELVAALK